MLLVGTTLLTSTLSTAKNIFHQLVLREEQVAMTSATADFISWSQQNIQVYGINQLPIWAKNLHTAPLQPICTDNRVPTRIDAAQGNCNLSERVTWSTTGFVRPEQKLDPQATSEATNVSLAQDEGRISATINIAITDASGFTVFSTASRQVTARVFDSFPYVAVTGVRDVSSQLRAIGPAEGDAGGFSRQGSKTSSIAIPPTDVNPAAYTNTTILTTIDCNNSGQNDLSDPYLDNNDVGLIPLRIYGNVAWKYETPCLSSIPVNPSSAPLGYTPQTNNIYGSSATKSFSWNKNDDDLSSFAY